MTVPAPLAGFIKESNRIEGIVREPTDREVQAFKEFLEIGLVSVGTLRQLVSVFQPGAQLRERSGMDVMVGNHYPLPGGPRIREDLEKILELINAGKISPYRAHRCYETLHPFMDGNGRSGRAVWAWQMLAEDIWPHLDLGFLHAFYYQTLAGK